MKKMQSISHRILVPALALMLLMTLWGCNTFASSDSGSNSVSDVANHAGDQDSDVDNSQLSDSDSYGDTSNSNLSVVTAIGTAATYRTPAPEDYVRVKDYISDIVVDLRYATADNFTGQVIYDFTDAYLRYGTVVKLREVQTELKKQGYLIKIWDAYRPFTAQQKMWEIYPAARYVATPAKGPSGHNLGGTMDITLVTLEGQDVPMPTEFDDFSTRADRDYKEITEPAASNVLILQNAMYQHGFKGYSGEWWDYTDLTTYPENNVFQPPTES